MTVNMELEEKKEVSNIKPEDEHSDNKKTSFITKMKDPVYRNVMLRWVCIPIATLNLGVIDSMGGTTIIDLEIITSTTKSIASLFFIASNLGYLLGSVLGGFSYGKIHSYLVISISGFFAGAASIASPYCTTFILMFLMRCVVGLFLGLLLCVANAEHMEIWGTKGEALLQLINFAYSLGGVIGPLVASPFLAEKEIESKPLPHQNWTNDNFSNISNHSDIALNSTLPRTTDVRYAFFIGGAILVLTAIPSLLVLILSKESIFHVKRIESQQENVDRKLPLGLKLFLIASLFWYFFTYSCVEVTFNSYLMTFVVDQYKEVTTTDGSHFSLYYWVSFAGGRFVSIFTSNYLTPIRIMYIHLVIMLTAFSGFLLSAIYSSIPSLIVFTCLAGIACSAMFPAGISWTEAEIMRVDGPISAVIFIGSSAGVMVIPFIVEHLMENLSNLWFCYSLMIALGLAFSFFVFLLTFNRYYVNRKYGKLCETRTPDIQVDPPSTNEEIHM